MQAQIDLGNIRLIKAVPHRVVEQSERVDVTRIRPDHELQFESPIEANLRVENAFRRDYRLIHHELIAPVVKKPAEVLIVFRRIDVSGKASFDPAVNCKARLRLLLFDEILLGVFLRWSEGLRI